MNMKYIHNIDKHHNTDHTFVSPYLFTLEVDICCMVMRLTVWDCHLEHKYRLCEIFTWLVVFFRIYGLQL